MMPISLPETREEFGVLVLGAIAIIIAHGVLRTQAEHRRRTREGYPPRPRFLDRVRRALKERRRV